MVTKGDGWKWARVALVLLLGGGAYSNTFDVPFHFDDYLHIADSTRAAGLRAFFSGPPSPSRLLAHLSFALNGDLGGRALLGFHLVNLVIHLGAALAVGALTTAVIVRVSRCDPEGVRWARWGGTFAALLFVAHPVQTQAVTYIVQRMTSMAALFVLAAVLVHLRSLDLPWGPRRAALATLGAGLTAAACLTKENAVVLPALVLLVDGFVAKGSVRERAARVAPYFGAAILAAALLLAPGSGVATVQREFREWGGAESTDRIIYLLTQPSVVLTYLRLLLVPVGLNFDYDYPAVTSWANARFLASAAALMVIVLAAAAGALRWGSARPLARLGLLATGWFAIALSVESSIIPLSDLINEHRLYLPSVGPIVALGATVAAALSRAGSAGRVRLVAACAVLLALLGAATWRRNELWRDPRALWGDVVAKSPGKGRPYAWLARSHWERGEFAEALEILEGAARLPRRDPHVLLALGNLRVKMGQPTQAVEAYRKVEALGAGGFPGVQHGLGLALLDLGRTAEACASFERELRAFPSSRPARENVANCRFVRGDARGALAEWTLLASEPDAAPETLFNLALAHATVGDAEGARRAYEAFLRSAGPELSQARAVAERWLAANPR